MLSREYYVRPDYGGTYLKLHVSRFEIDQGTLAFTPCAAFCLPLTLENSSGPFICRPFHSTEQRPAHAPRQMNETAPSPAPAPMLAFEFHLINPEGSNVYTVFAYTAPLLNPRHQDRKDRRDKNVPWNEWGPRSTFWFPGRFENASMYGYRVLYKEGTKTVLLDFTPSEVACRRGAIPTGCIVEGTSFRTPHMQITTTAAFLRIESDRLDYTEYILGDNILALKVMNILSSQLQTHH